MLDIRKLHEELTALGIGAEIEIGKRPGGTSVYFHRHGQSLFGRTLEDIEDSLSDIPAVSALMDKKYRDEKVKEAKKVLLENGYEVRGGGADTANGPDMTAGQC